MNDNDTRSRTRPGKQLDPRVRLLRELRTATRNYVTTLEAGLSVLTEELVGGDPQLATIRTLLRVATGARSTGAGYAFGTPINIERLLSQALGEAEGEVT